MTGVTILGATGSIGASTLDVLGRYPDRFRIVALSANGNVARMAELCRRYRPEFAVMADPVAADELQGWLRREGYGDTQVLAGPQGLEMVARLPQVGVVMAAIVGAAGLGSSLAAARAGKRVLLANKEALVVAGKVFMDAVREGGAELLPIDSEHNAVFQCLPPARAAGLGAAGVRRILLTASGGPFRTRSVAEMARVTPDEACAHPTWAMGRKISVDSATLMNKGLEVIEARWLFDARPEQIEVVIHPQSIVHSMVEYVDGSVLAQLGSPDMRTPIAYSLGFPERLASGAAPLDLFVAGRLDFEAPDLVRFPCLRLAYEALRRGGTAPAILNAANEIAVQAFLDGRLGFTQIPQVIEEALGQVAVRAADQLGPVLDDDAAARAAALETIARLGGVDR